MLFLIAYLKIDSLLNCYEGTIPDEHSNWMSTINCLKVILTDSFVSQRFICNLIFVATHVRNVN